MTVVDLKSYFADCINNIKDKQIVFWGCSNFLSEVLENYKFQNVISIVDIDTKKQNTDLYGYKIISPEVLNTINPDIVVFSVYSENRKRYSSLKLDFEKKYPSIKLYDNIFERYDEKYSVKYYCPYCDSFDFFVNFGNPVRYNIKCPKCGALERHRFLYYVYQKYILSDRNKKIKILHTAPEKSIYNLFVSSANVDYTSIDLFPEKYSYVNNCLKMDVLNLKFADNTFDYIISNHVVEHIENERLFFKELLRVLKPDGKMILTAPYYSELEYTFEDASIVTSEERLKYYGQSDHVRKYGRDIYERFSQYAKVTVVDTKDLISKDLISKMNLTGVQTAAIIERNN